ncbi:MAG: SufD family Fe-S cluster assembly protein [Candidatus Levybacteria bacterium]|nr:SufD family Fe-S cluster assembly protein [Candidatus Levybacteria bacterium]
MKNIIVKENEELILPVVWFGKEKEINCNIKLAGINSSLTLLMLLIGKKEDKVKIQISVDHQNKETKSKVLVKAIINDSANVDFEGKVKIEKGSKGSNAWLSANLLLLSDKAKGRAVPALEILENDIKAGHATTVGRVSDAELFYLMSRGLPRIKARDLIIQGFLNGFLQTFPDGQIKEKARKRLKYEE